MTAAEWASRTQGRCRRLGRGQLETQPRLPPPPASNLAGPPQRQRLAGPCPGPAQVDLPQIGAGRAQGACCPLRWERGWGGQGRGRVLSAQAAGTKLRSHSLPFLLRWQRDLGRAGGADRGARGVGFLLSHGPLHTWAQTALGARTGGRLPHCPPTGPLPSCGLHPGPPLPPTQAAPLHWPHVSSWPRPRPSGGCSGEPLLSPTPSSACWSDPQPFLLEMWGFQGAFHLAASCVGCSSRPRVRALTPQPWEGVRWAWGRSPKPAGAGPCSVLWSSSPCSHSSAAGCRARLPCRSHGQQTRVHPGFLRPCSPDSLAAPTARGVHPLPEKAATLRPCPGLDAQWVLTPATPPAQGPPRASFSSPHATRPPAALPFPD